MKIDIRVPNGESGDWMITTKTVDPETAKFSQMRAIFSGGGRGYLPPGEYKILYRDNTVVMSNTPDEINDHMPFIRKATGSVLINGLGIGVVVQALIDKPEVTEIIVIEKSPDVIKLTGPTYQDNEKVTIINADAFEYQPPKGKRYNAVWHDIWDTICEDNLSEMGKLHRKYGRKTDYQASWCKWECQKQRRESNRYMW